jgi:hypothetical protein
MYFFIVDNATMLTVQSDQINTIAKFFRGSGFTKAIGLKWAHQTIRWL